MGHTVDFLRVEMADLERPFEPDAAWLSAAQRIRDADGEMSEDWKPHAGEAAGDYAARLLVADGVGSPVWDLFDALPGTTTVEQFDRIGTYFCWLDELVRAYGDSRMLGFLHERPTRSDVRAHRERLPERVGALAKATAAYVLVPEEVRALQRAWAKAKADGLARMAAFEGPDENAATFAEEVGDGQLMIWMVQGLDGVTELDDLPLIAPTPGQHRPATRRQILATTAIALAFGLLMGGLAVLLRSCG